jgi:hypothetical protein
LFNPIRPLEGNAQADADSDGVGDICDPCPLDAATATCSAADPDDRDNDGTDNLLDNCPWDANPAQTDSDDDGKGDACDLCPTDSNPGTAGCPSTIYAVKDRSVPLGQRVVIPDAIDTAQGPEGFFMQTDPASADYTGPDFSAVYVFDPDSAQPEVGWRVSVDGVVADYYTQIELTAPAVTVLDTVPLYLTPLLIDPADAAPSGSKVEEYEALLVAVQDVSTSPLHWVPSIPPAPSCWHGLF